MERSRWETLSETSWDMLNSANPRGTWDMDPGRAEGPIIEQHRESTHTKQGDCSEMVPSEQRKVPTTGT